MAGGLQLPLLTEADHFSVLSCSVPVHSCEWQVPYRCEKSMNSNCNQQVDLDWINLSYYSGMKPKQRFRCDLTVINGSRGNWNDTIIIPPCKMPESNFEILVPWKSSNQSGLCYAETCLGVSDINAMMSMSVGSLPGANTRKFTLFHVFSLSLYLI